MIENEAKAREEKKLKEQVNEAVEAKMAEMFPDSDADMDVSVCDRKPFTGVKGVKKVGAKKKERKVWESKKGKGMLGKKKPGKSISMTQAIKIEKRKEKRLRKCGKQVTHATS